MTFSIVPTSRYTIDPARDLLFWNGPDKYPDGSNVPNQDKEAIDANDVAGCGGSNFGSVLWSVTNMNRDLIARHVREIKDETGSTLKYAVTLYENDGDHLVKPISVEVTPEQLLDERGAPSHNGHLDRMPGMVGDFDTFPGWGRRELWPVVYRQAFINQFGMDALNGQSTPDIVQHLIGGKQESPNTDDFKPDGIDPRAQVIMVKTPKDENWIDVGPIKFWNRHDETDRDEFKKAGLTPDTEYVVVKRDGDRVYVKPKAFYCSANETSALKEVSLDQFNEFFSGADINVNQPG